MFEFFSFHCGLGIDDWGLDGKQEEDGKGFWKRTSTMGNR